MVKRSLKLLQLSRKKKKTKGRSDPELLNFSSNCRHDWINCRIVHKKSSKRERLRTQIQNLARDGGSWDWCGARLGVNIQNQSTDYHRFHWWTPRRFSSFLSLNPLCSQLTDRSVVLSCLHLLSFLFFFVLTPWLIGWPMLIV